MLPRDPALYSRLPRRANLELYFEYLNVVEVMGYKGEFQDYAMEQGMTALANNIKALHQKFRTEKASERW